MVQNEKPPVNPKFTGGSAYLSVSRLIYLVANVSAQGQVDMVQLALPLSAM